MSAASKRSGNNWSTLAVLLTISVPTPSVAQTPMAKATTNNMGLNFNVGSEVFTLGSDGNLIVPNGGTFGSGATFGSIISAPMISIGSVPQPFDAARMNLVNSLYSLSYSCTAGQALATNGDGTLTCVELSDLYSANGGQLGTATLPNCTTGQLITSDGNSLSCTNALPTSCPAGAVPVADGNGGWTCGICPPQSVSWTYPNYGTCSGTLPQGLQGQTVLVQGSGPGVLQGAAGYQCFDNTWTQSGEGYCSPPPPPPSPPSPPPYSPSYSPGDGNQ